MTDSSTAVLSVHLAFGNSRDSITVGWLTLDTTATSTVQYGLAPGALSLSATGSASTYDHVGAGYNHFVSLSGLTMGATYFYVCGDAAGGWSETFNFTVTTGQTPFSIGVWGDLGTGPGDPTIAGINAASSAWDFALHFGDISYANDHPFDFERTWQAWMEALEPTFAHMPFQVMPGNHESNCRNPICELQTMNFSTYLYKFSMPWQAAGALNNMFYSFDYGPVHFVAISTETDYPGYPIDPTAYSGRDASFLREDKAYFQVNWLHADLAAAVANRAAVPFIILMGHRPIYCATNDESKGGVPILSGKTMQQWLEPILAQYQVDMYLCGHSHLYERMWPVYANEVTGQSYTNPASTVYVVLGNGGNVEGISSFSQPLPPWHAGGDDAEFGFATLVVYNSTSIGFEYRRATDAAVFDSFMYTRTDRAPPSSSSSEPRREV
eukprot:c2815_g1_i1.p1 GENE.c2815_g1_i1~~c2815_g1_i1.p1  ORF type:complete len:481 (+),score=78.24 c2815_g1_i1:128-1444(+)